MQLMWVELRNMRRKELKGTADAKTCFGTVLMVNRFYRGSNNNQLIQQSLSVQDIGQGISSIMRFICSASIGIYVCRSFSFPNGRSLNSWVCLLCDECHVTVVMSWLS